MIKVNVGMTSERADHSSFVPVMKGSAMRNCRQHRGIAIVSFSGIRNVILLVLGSLAMNVVGQGVEDFENIPTTSPTTYTNRTWTGTDGVTWTAEGARTDQTLNTKAICFGTSGNRWVTSPIYAGGMGTLAFDYVRGFTSGTARTIQVWVNGTQIGGNIAVSTSSDTPVSYSQAINIAGNVQVEIRSISGGQVRVDDITWTPFTAGPTITFTGATASAGEAAGSVTINLAISPATVAAATVTVRLTNGAGCTYGAPPNDYQTTPAAAGAPLTFTLTVPIGSTGESFTIDINDDIATEFNETITCRILSVTGGLAIGTPIQQVFTIIDNDVTPTVNFSTLSITVMETAGLQNFSLSIFPAATAAGTITIQVTNGPGATYGGGQDYLSNPGIFGGFITVPFALGATSAGFTITVLNDALVELTETVNFTVTAVSAGNAVGGSNGSVLTIGDDDSPPTVLSPGDLVIVGVNANDFACSGGPVGGYDLVSFFCFKPIVPGTEIIITDNGYERCNAGQWGNSEGTVRMTRTGIAIPAGQVITFRMQNLAGPTNVTSFAPDGAWTCASLNAPVGGVFATAVALNSGGEQLFFMQGGLWGSGTAPANVYAHNATYTGTILYAFSSNPSPNWTASCGGSGSQQSNLPPGVECFSMAPTSSSDWGKYDGVVTAATQRDWIIRIDNTASWTPYLSCANYNSMGNSWVSAPMLPIIVAPFVPGRWRGTTDYDWFNCKNWDDVQVPLPTTDVTIDPLFSVSHCTVGLNPGVNPGGTGVCASITMTNVGGAARTLTIAPNSGLNVNGPVNLAGTNTGTLLLTMGTNTILNAVDLNLSSNITTFSQFSNANNVGLANFTGNVNLNLGGYINLTNGNLDIGGDWSNFENETRFIDTGSRVRFIGALPQTITIATGDEYFSTLVLNKSAGALTLNNPVRIRTSLDLTSGLLNTSNPAGLVTLLASGTTTNASNTSFVNGPMQKIGNTNFSFPVGKGAVLRPCGVTGYGAASAASGFIAEYFPISAYTWGIPSEPTINHLSQCEYWTIDRSVGVANPVVELTWLAPNSCGVTLLPDLLVARWDDAVSIWRDRGNGGATGTLGAGVIPTAAIQSLFNASPGPTPWTLASTTSENPLPISLVQFNATPDGEVVRLEWVTASERDNAYFTIERSKDGTNFEPVMDVPGAMNSTSTLNYTELDREPYSGLSYYRLRQTDVDGNTTYSNVVAIMMGALNERPLVAFNNGGGLTALHGFPAGSRFALQDMTGRIIVEGSTTIEGRTELQGLDLARGAYLFRLLNGDRTESTKFVY